MPNKRWPQGLAKCAAPTAKPYKSKLERQYESYLEEMRRAGLIIWYAREDIRLRVAGTKFYTPDFVVQATDGVVEFHEVKGSWKAKGQRDQRTRIVGAAERYPFRFKAVTRERGLGWVIEAI